jgi:glycosyltransferase involved in cell wall biosynthesis
MVERKIGALTACWCEEATIIFTIASLLPHVDYYVVVDSGSTDKTLELIKKCFEEELKSGKLNLIEYGPLEDFDISKPKNAAIEAIREAGCSHFIRLDADDVFYDKGAKKAVKAAHALKENVTMFTINHWELYQNTAHTTLEWLDQLEENKNWLCLRMPPGANPTMSGYPHRFDGSYGHARIYKVEGAVSNGKWTDEAWGLGPGEDIGHPGLRRNCIGNHDEDIVHYGWARPMQKKLKKGQIWRGESDPRIDGIEKAWENVEAEDIGRTSYGMKYWPRSIIFPFTKHPEVVERMLPQVREILNETSGLPSNIQ